MPTYATEAIVLRRLDYGEADRILTLLTRSHGKVRAIAKGVRRAKSRAAGHLDLFSHSRMLLARGRNLDVVAQCERLHDPDHLAGDLVRTAYASLVAEVADKVLEERHPVADVFDLVADVLQALNRLECDPRAEASYFLMRVLNLLGYAPQLQLCVHCERPLPEAPAQFSPLLGGVLCSGCTRYDLAASPVSVTALKVLRVMASEDRELFARLRLQPDLLRELELALEHQLEYHLDRRLKSLEFLQTLRRAAVPVTAR
jgi:DNA repair protein RecO (recombination protein O)